MGKKPKTRIDRIKKRAHQLVTDPEAALEDLDKHMKKTFIKPIETTKKNIDKTQKAVVGVFTTLVTSAGNIIKLRKKEIATGTTAVAVGMTVNEVMKNLHYPQQPEKEIVLQRATYEDYITLAKKHPENLSNDEWISLLLSISQKLENNLRIRLELSEDQKFNLHKLLTMADEKEMLEPDECSKLHEFRKDERNPITHAQKEEVDKFELILWVANFVKNLEEEKITEITE